MGETEWQWLRRNWLRVLLFLTLLVITSAGLYQLSVFIPDYSVDEEEMEGNPRFAFSVLIGFGLTALGFYLYFEQKKKLKLLKDALQVLRYLGHLPKLRNNSLYPDEFDPSKNIALGLILESRGILHSFGYYDRKLDLDKILGKLDENERLYKRLERLDQLILDNLEDRIKQKFPKQVYFLRLRLLRVFRDAEKEGEFLRYDKHNFRFGKEEKILYEFSKKVLNQFYSYHNDYSPQPVKFDPRVLRKYFSEVGQEDYRSNLKYFEEEE